MVMRILIEHNVVIVEMMMLMEHHYDTISLEMMVILEITMMW